MWTGPLLALVLQVALVSSGALLARAAKPAAVVLGAAAFLGAPWLAGPLPLVRGLGALLGGVGLLRVVDLVRSIEPWGARRRLLHVLSFVDSRTLRRAKRHVDLVAVGRALLWDAVAAPAFHLAHAPQELVRWLGGLVFVYAVVESGYALIGAAYRALGFIAPRLHVLPLASVSVGELWGVRWARPISAWLRETCFLPLARRGHPTLGLALGFVASGIGHAYPVVVALDLPMGAVMLAFFLAQAVFVILEARLRASRWPRAARRAWTVLLMVASSPLFVEPALGVLGLPRADGTCVVCSARAP